MNFKSGSLMFLTNCAALTLLIAIPGAGFAADQDQVQARLRDRIMADTGLTAGEMSKYDPLITEALELNGGDPEPVREMFRKSVREGCVEECLMERLRNRNRAMLQERKMLDGAGKEQARTRERTRERTRDQAGEQAGEQTRERIQEQNQEQSGTGSGNGKGNGNK